MKFIKAFIALLFFYSCTAQPRQATLVTNKDDNTLLWEVSGNGLKQASYLFGTFHLMCKDDIHFSSQLKTALGNADKVYMEMKMDDPAVLLGGLFMMNMEGGKKLSDLYTPGEYTKVKHFFTDSLHTPLTMFQKVKPFFLEAMIYPKMMPCKTISGVEEELMKLAKENKKEIKGLETIQFQTSVFDSIPYQEQAKELLNSIDSMVSYQKYFDTMTHVYQSQQIMAIEAMFSKSEFGMTGHQDILLDDRNKNWVGQLKGIMQKEAVLVAVGAGHLVGSKGLIELLRKEGYAIRPLLNQ
jgi:uncharacterized protein